MFLSHTSVFMECRKKMSVLLTVIEHFRSTRICAMNVKVTPKTLKSSQKDSMLKGIKLNIDRILVLCEEATQSFFC